MTCYTASIDHGSTKAGFKCVSCMYCSYIGRSRIHAVMSQMHHMPRLLLYLDVPVHATPQPVPHDSQHDHIILYHKQDSERVTPTWGHSTCVHLYYSETNVLCTSCGYYRILSFYTVMNSMPGISTYARTPARAQLAVNIIWSRRIILYKE